jgi:phosphatidate cytidylyltransferase
MKAVSRSRELTLRVLTGVVGIAGLVGLIVQGGIWGVRLIAWGISVLTLVEFGRMAFHARETRAIRVILIFLATVLHLTQIHSRDFSQLAFHFLILFGFFLFHAHRSADLRRTIDQLVMAFFGYFYLGVLPLFLVDLRSVADHSHFVLLYCGMIWATDVGAYFVGIRFGKTRLLPLISPKKSVEGLLGGMALAVLTALAYRHHFELEMRPGALVISTILVSFSSQVGDLCESYFKRAFDLKDSGSLLPGHGGVWDRFDGFIWALPIMVACLPVLR